ncbi:MAG: hypothetical protein ABR879_05105 [Methanomassiliicoccales archaeon]|jgi:hypothetical protein
MLAILAVVVVASSFLMIVFTTGHENNTFSLKAGDFLEYSDAREGISQIMLVDNKIVSVSGDWINYTSTTFINGSLAYQDFFNQTANNTVFAPDVHDPRLTNVTYVGYEAIAFPWGLRGVDHYVVNPGKLYAEDIWLRNGIAVKLTIRHAGMDPVTHQLGYLTETDTLVASNMPQVL